MGLQTTSYRSAWYALFLKVELGNAEPFPVRATFQLWS